MSRFRHGHTGKGWASPTYRSWYCMKQRCTNPNAPNYKHYGGKGIRLCPRWELFHNFLADMGERPPETSLDRIDGTKNYNKENCRWVTSKEQRRNQHGVCSIDSVQLIRNLAQQTVPHKQIAKQLQMPLGTVRRIIYRETWNDIK